MTMRVKMPRRRKGRPVHGWVLLDKPVGMSSNQAVGAVRRIFDAQKAGHAGTLDPLASGVLPIALGEATKTMSFVMGGEKSYSFSVRWGQATNTDDLEGDVVSQSDHRPSKSDIEAVLPQFLGEISQKPPAYSAIKVNGKRAYALARQGESVDLAARHVRVAALTLRGDADPDHAAFDLTCSKGTYVRSLARDMGEALKTCAHVTSLRRTRVGRFDEKDAISLSSLEELGYRGASRHYLLPVVTALDDIPALAVTGTDANLLRHGQPIVLTRGQVDEMRGMTSAYAALGKDPVAIGEFKSGRFFPTRVFNLPMKWKIADVDYS